MTCTVTVEDDLDNAATASASVLDGDRDLGPFTATASVAVNVEEGTGPSSGPSSGPTAGPGDTPQGGVTPVSGGVLPDTGAPADALPLTLLGPLLVGAGAWLSRRRRG